MSPECKVLQSSQGLCFQDFNIGCANFSHRLSQYKLIQSRVWRNQTNKLLSPIEASRQKSSKGHGFEIKV